MWLSTHEVIRGVAKLQIKSDGGVVQCGAELVHSTSKKRL